MFHLFLLFCCCSHLYHKYIPTKRICQYQITRKIKKNKENLQFYTVFTCFFLCFFIFHYYILAQNPNFPLACMSSAAGMVLSSSSVIILYPCDVLAYICPQVIYTRRKCFTISSCQKQKKIRHRAYTPRRTYRARVSPERIFFVSFSEIPP